MKKLSKCLDLHLIRIIKGLHDANEPLARDVLKGCVQISPSWLPKAGYIEFCEMRIFRVVRLCCKHIFKNNKLIEIEHNVMQKRNMCKIFNDINFN